MLRGIRNILHSRRKRFKKISKHCELNISYQSNRDAVTVLEDIFVSREYSDYFPFYEKATIVDIGAHYGYFSIFASKNTHKESNILAIEPSKKNYKILKENLENCKITNVKPLQVAVGEKESVGELYEGSSVNNSIIEDYPLLGQEKNKSIIKILDLNSLIEQNNIEVIDFLKLDCEGAEYSIILNSTTSVFEKIKVLSMEFHDLKNPNFTANKLVQKLKENKFDIAKYTYDKTNLNLNYGKLIAIKK